MEIKLHGTSQINQQQHLQIGGVDAVTLAQTYGTPLYVYDTSFVRNRAQAFKETFATEQVKAQVAYASKAFATVAMYQLMHEEGLSLDVVSAGELYTAVQAGFPAERIHFHGNNKTEAELRYAISEQVGCYVIDNFDEIELLNRLASEMSATVNALIRVTPGVEAHTHEFITTGQDDSKFGFGLLNGQTEAAIQLLQTKAHINHKGIHCHIGSQIFEMDGFITAADRIITKMAEWQMTLNYTVDVLNLGGGFGIHYTDEDEPLAPETYVRHIIQAVKQQTAALGLDLPEIWIEPGRSLVGEAGTTLYTVGSSKKVPGIRQYVAVDGGMGDNIRPALYEAKYSAALANRMNEPADTTVSIAGKYCESGDMLIWDAQLPQPVAGDVLAMFSTGAYGYSMASNYNRVPRAAVVFVADGQHRLVVKRESFADLVRNDLQLRGE
ncbi:diaminopimelate decarboxylase [Brochothrix campestris FSL F6-1037]|uniref:Diaminopimelate decarboxylase n=1 Tax=Brochothrix campestris FSL F6-1037 TaxID=1265861 RepID=W7D0X0_9LIST|nr:diaminopimelate decarboxylase [Brochothrix campestris FSL F6-1037]